MRKLLTIKDLLETPEEELEPLLTKAKGISQRFEEYLAEDRGDSHTRHPGIHASEVSGCQRKVVYSLLGEKRVEKIENRWKKRFKIGHAIHEMFQKDFARMSEKSNYVITFQDEVKIYPSPAQVAAAEWQIYSSCDGIFTIRETWDGPAIVRCGLEIKSASPDDFEKIREPKPEHVEQAHVYMACLDIPVMWFLYYNKGNQNYTSSDNPSFFIRFNPKKWEELKTRFEKAHTHVHNGDLPDRQESVGCEFCAFSWTCQPKYLQNKGAHRTHNRWSKP